MADRQKHTFNAEISKVLKLMIHSIYTNKDIFLRELVSNAVDATEKRKYICLADDQLALQGGDYNILVKVDGDKLVIRDHGIGMNKDDLVANLGTIAKSGTEEFIKNLSSKDVELIGQFGVGFYSVFMVADKVDVITKKAGDEQAYLWHSDGESGYTVEEYNRPFDIGTEISLHIKDELKDVYLDRFKLRYIIETYSSNVGVPIDLEFEQKTDRVSSNIAIWQKDKKEITEEEYKNFYKSVSHLPDKPFITIHSNIDGNVNFKALLFVPSMKPFDLFNPERETRVKIYVKKVFISESGLDIMPKYLRFVYGIIDSNDLPLNISRETLQDTYALGKIKDVVVKKIFGELKQKSATDHENYNKFWSNFGNVVKEGLCESGADRETILEICRFYSSKSGKEMISLDEYLARKKEDQKEIYYCIGDSPDDMLSNPQIEAFIKNDIEVIFLTDTVDSFWVNVVLDYKGNDLKSISHSDVKLNDDKKEKNQHDKDHDENIIDVFTEVLLGKVKEVKLSNKLTESPACLAIHVGAMDIKMERYLVEQNQLNNSTLKILEVNPENKLVNYAVQQYQDDATKDRGHEMITTIFEMACIAQGELIRNPASFIKHVNHLISNITIDDDFVEKVRAKPAKRGRKKKLATEEHVHDENCHHHTDEEDITSLQSGTVGSIDIHPVPSGDKVN
jgi:molecular chaperone HtpG